MLDPQELKQFEEVVQLVVKNEVNRTVKKSEERMTGKIIESEKRMTDKIVESEKRMTDKIVESEERMTGKIQESEMRMTDKIEESEKKTADNIRQLGIEIGDFITSSILPQIEKKASSDELKKLAVKTQEHEVILKKIKSGFLN